MKVPARLQPLVADGIIDEVLYPLKSGKEAQIFVVRADGEIVCAKVYKEASQRSFKQAAQYQEGRTYKGGRRSRAMAKNTRFGQAEAEKAWLNAEVEALKCLAAAGVRVPTPYSYVDGVLLMELIQDESGDPAPRLDDVAFPEDIAADYHRHMMGEIAKMLCAGLVHGDLSEFNVLVDAYGPVIIDLPQAVDAARNNNAKAMFMRDINNMTQYFGRYNPSLLSTRFGEEIWQLYQHGELTPASELTGVFTEVLTEVDLDAVLSVIEHAKAEEAERQARLLADQNDD
ncbi:MAG TPA: PA4780 family RIO1-like protein kinase [Cellvibrionaceae bacterium]|nr:PA4780 family RIO1-like protein kinase [Cellvibrionaceae bacterium]HMW72247.1 PA4780 family RIO1-like protein kinase [Cellvibrionaceae bacterium]HMY38293.1 PA4780 family RIO1-like protein kinase [Marinagarivorans sp.]HNG58650.1 PA4780 family RIO1-like protein kinase [Cellvibrionaceae bacterium]